MWRLGYLQILGRLRPDDMKDKISGVLGVVVSDNRIEKFLHTKRAGNIFSSLIPSTLKRRGV